jgi:hypothetical protein
MQYRKLILTTTFIVLLLAIFGCTPSEEQSVLDEPVKEEAMIEAIHEQMDVSQLARA